ARLGQHHEIARRGIWRRRHIDADMLALEMTRHRGTGSSGEKPNGPASGVRKLDQQRLSKSRAAVGQQRVAYLFDAGIDRLDDRDPAEQRFPKADEPRPEEVG